MLVAMVRDRRESRLGPRPGVREERVGLGRRARLRGDDDERPQRIEVVEDLVDVGGVGRIEDPQLEVALGRAERPAQDVGGEAAAAHAGHDRGRVALVDDGVTEGLETRDLLREVLRSIEPAEALRDGLGDTRVGGPQADVAGEQAARPLLGPGSFDRCLVRGGTGSECETGSGDGGRDGVGHRGLRAWFSMVRRRTPRGPCDFVDVAPHGVPWRRREAPVRPPDRPRRPPSRGPCRGAGGAVARR